MRRMAAVIAASAAALCVTGAAAPALAGKPNIPGGCAKCHTAVAQTVRGKIGTVSEGFKTFQVAVGSLIWIVSYDDALAVREGERTSGPERLADLPRDKEVLVRYRGEEASPLAVELLVKQPYKVPAEQLASIEEVEALLAGDPGAYVLLDARPPEVYLQGHIPTARSLPFGAFEKLAGSVLPPEKDRLLVFYCGGVT